MVYRGLASASVKYFNDIGKNNCIFEISSNKRYQITDILN